jgi:hypothetical protein
VIIGKLQDEEILEDLLVFHLRLKIPKEFKCITPDTSYAEWSTASAEPFVAMA